MLFYNSWRSSSYSVNGDVNPNKRVTVVSVFWSEFSKRRVFPISIIAGFENAGFTSLFSSKCVVLYSWSSNQIRCHDIIRLDVYSICTSFSINMPSEASSCVSFHFEFDNLHVSHVHLESIFLKVISDTGFVKIVNGWCINKISDVNRVGDSNESCSWDEWFHCKFLLKFYFYLTIGQVCLYSKSIKWHDVFPSYMGYVR